MHVYVLIGHWLLDVKRSQKERQYLVFRKVSEEFYQNSCSTAGVTFHGQILLKTGFCMSFYEDDLSLKFQVYMYRSLEHVEFRVIHVLVMLLWLANCMGPMVHNLNF
jgi:hypothetical protein